MSNNNNNVPQNLRRSPRLNPKTEIKKTNIFTRIPEQTITGRKRPASEPAIPTAKRPQIKRQSVTDKEQTIFLSKDDMLRILSKEMPMDKASIVATFMSNNNITNQEVPSVYSSFFFRKDIIKEFQRSVINTVPQDKLAGFPLSNYNLYNKDDILNNTTYKENELGTRITESATGFSRESTKNVDYFIKILSKSICSGIDPTYAASAVNRAIDLMNNQQTFDILIISTKVIEDVTLSIEKRLEGVVAFIIVELGECKKYPSSYSINLICTNTNKAIPGTGSILMGAFLYTILAHPDNKKPTEPIKFPKGNSYLKVTSKQLANGNKIEYATFGTNEQLVPTEHVAVLELASAYQNTGGLCMYEKFGFQFDDKMFSDSSKGIDCFNDRENLPMKIDFNKMQGYAELSIQDKKKKIVDITAGIDKGFPKSPICSVRGEKQRLLGYLKFIQLTLDYKPGAKLDDFLRGSPEGVLARQLQTINDSINTSSTSRGMAALMNQYKNANSATPSKPGDINEFIKYLEDPLKPEDPEMEKKLAKLITFLPKIKKGGYTKKSGYRRKLTRKLI